MTETVQAKVPGADQDWEILVPLGPLGDWMDAQGLEPGPIEAVQARVARRRLALA